MIALNGIEQTKLVAEMFFKMNLYLKYAPRDKVNSLSIFRGNMLSLLLLPDFRDFKKTYENSVK